jgi:DNA-binding MarR family transcriptional regulator
MPRREIFIEEIMHSFHSFRSMIRAKVASLSHANHITHSRWIVLKLIEQAGEPSIKHLSEMLGMSSSAVTQFVDALVESGYVKRRDDPKDRRIVKLTLSPKGKKHITATKSKRVTEMADLFGALTDSELEEYARLQKKIVSSSLDTKT